MRSNSRWAMNRRNRSCPDLLEVGAPLPRRTAVPQHRRHQIKTLPRNLVVIVCLVASPIFLTTCGLAQGPLPPTVRYTLLKHSNLNVSCPNCGPPPPRPPAAMSGTLTLKLLDNSDPLVTRYQLTDISFAAQGNGGEYHLTGEGTYQVGGN